MYAKDPIEIHGIKRRMNEGLQAFMDRFKSKTSHIMGIPPMLSILAFMHSYGHPELAKKLNNKIPKTMDEMFERVRAFLRGDRQQGRSGQKEFRRNMGTCAPYSRRDTFTPLIKMPKEILAMEDVNFPPPSPLIRTLKNDTAKKTDEVVMEKENVDDVTGSIEIRKEQKQIPTPSPTRSLRNVSSSDKTVSEELTSTVSPTPATTSKVSSKTKCKKRFISYRSKTLPGSIAAMCR
nr:reverse transcriptase domain-containing protein [Tanacetum cinerariifolium]